MDEPTPDSHFKTMCFMYKFRDLFLPRKNVLKEVDIKPGFHILDYGCGPGSYSIVAARLVGDSGKVYALDVHPLAIQRVGNAASKKGLKNIETIQSDCATGLGDESIDIAFLYDILHHLSEPDAVLGELHRVLKPSGILSCNDHHLKEEEIISKIISTGLFKLSSKGKKTYSFSKGQQPVHIVPPDVK
ncbi:MAG: class I SAM-dependent methyltransferase [Candidatus Zixiibacteriota bacterium]